MNKFGYIESPYKKVVNGKVTSEIKYLSAIEEEKFTIAQANSVLNQDDLCRRTSCMQKKFKF